MGCSANLQFQGSKMPMTDETSSPRSLPPHAEGGRDGDISTLRKELIEARNLVIKTDTLLKNLHAELKQMGRKHEEQEKRHWMTSVTAYIGFAVIAGVGAIAYANAEVRTARSDAQANEARSEEHTSELQSPCNLVCRLLLE